MRLADAEGLAAVTMRRLAAELDVEAMSLYHHLPGKDALLDGLIEAIVTEIGESDPPGWRRPRRPTGATTLRRRCLAARTVMQSGTAGRRG